MRMDEELKEVCEVKRMIEVLSEDYKMSQREVARYLGITQKAVAWWHLGLSFPTRENYERLQDMLMKLSGKKVKYKGQAIDILNGEE